jgi:hypothetical protein
MNTTLEDLKKRATAAELTLIERTEELLRPAVENEVKTRAVGFLNRNMPPSRDEIHRVGKEGADKWVAQFTAALTPQ